MKKRFNCVVTLLLVLFVQLTFAQEKVILGNVSDESGPLPGVNVIKKGTTKGAETDFDGNYVLKAEKGDILVYTFVGMETVTKTVGASTKINVVMKGSNILDEVIVTATGVEKKKDEDLSSSTVVKTEALGKSGESGVVQSLAGKTSGLKITKSSGDPGAGANIQIRGANSINGGSSPLIVVDGIPMSNASYGSGTDGVVQQSRLNDINPDDIASVTVLKGASAAAVWGTAAANGVIMIQTKKGKSGKVSVNFKSQVSVDFINREFAKQGSYGQGSEGYYSPSAGGSWGDKIASRSGEPDSFNTTGAKFKSDSDNLYYPYKVINIIERINARGRKVKQKIYGKNSKEVFNDKNKEQVFRSGVALNNSFSTSFSSEKSKTFMSFSNLSQKGIIRGKSTYDRNTLRLNHDVNLTDKVSVRFNSSYSHVASERIQQGSNLQGLYLGYLRTSPDFDNTDYSGSYIDASGVASYRKHRAYRGYLGRTRPVYANPGWITNKLENPNTVERFTIAPQLNWKFNSNISLTARYGLDYYTDQRETFMPLFTSAREANGNYNIRNISEKGQNVNIFINSNTQINEDINFNAIVGATYDRSEYSSLKAGLRGFSNTDVRDVRLLTNSKVENRTIETRFVNTAKVGAYSVLNFDLFKQVLVEASGRLDKPSTVKDVNFFPSVLVGWKFGELLDNKDFLSFGKLRASWGKVGIEPTAYLNATTYEPNGVSSSWGDGLSASSYGNPFERYYIQGNPDLTIENVTEYEGGLDLRFWNNKINLGITYYDRLTKDAILARNVPASTGFTKRWENAAVISNKGIELDLGISLLKTQDLSWRVDANFSKNKNLVEDLAGVESVTLRGFSSVSSNVVQGHPMGTLWGTSFEKDENGKLVLDKNGFPKAADVQGAMGDPNPDWSGGFSSSLKYKQLSFSASFETSQGNDHWTGTEGVLKHFGIHPETAVETTTKQEVKNFKGKVIPAGTTFRGSLKKFNDDGPTVALDEQWYTGLGGGFGSVGSQNIKDASWTRLREVTLGYSLPKGFVESLGLSNFDLSFSGRNLVLWTDIEGFDPDINLTGTGNAKGLDYFTNPSTKSYILTLKLGF